MPTPSIPNPTSNLQRAIQAALAGVNVCLPATVASYDHATQKASIKVVPCFRRTVRGEVTCYRPPIIPGVPVLFMGGSGGDYSDTWPMEVGDPGFAIFCDRSTDEWLSTGSDETEPQDERRHDITDAVFIPAGRSFADPVGATGRDANARVIKAPTLLLGSSAAVDYVALSSLVSTEIQRIWTVLTTWVVAPGDGGAALKAAAITASASIGSVAATKVKAE